MNREPKPKPGEIEELPDAWERFEKAFDTGDESEAQADAG
jgi:hypothetical protein